MVDLTLKLADVYHKQSRESHSDVNRKVAKLTLAEEFCSRVIINCPDPIAFHHSAAQLLLGEVLQDQGRLNEAEVEFSRALKGLNDAVAAGKLAPDHSRIIYYNAYLADLYWEQKRYDEAEFVWRKALEAF